MIKNKNELNTFKKYLQGTVLGANFLAVKKFGQQAAGFNFSKYSQINFLKTPFYFVGSGSSFSVALLARDLFTHYTNIPCFAYTMYDYLNFAKNGGTVFVISHSGSTPDVLSAISWAQKMKSQVFAVSSATLENQAKNLFKFLRTDQVFDTCCQAEDAFVNSASPLVSGYVFLEILSFYKKQVIGKDFFNPRAFSKLFDNSFKKISSLKIFDPIDQHFVCLGSGLATAAIMELDLKISEAVLEDSERSELKNYSHGRFLKTILYPRRNYFYIFLGVKHDKKLINFLRSKLKYPSFVVLRNFKDPFLNSWQLFSDALMLSAFLSFCKNRFRNDKKVFDPATFKIPLFQRDFNVGFNLLANRRRSIKKPIITI